MVRVLGLACLLVIAMCGTAKAQEALQPCELTSTEEAARDVLLQRLIQPGDPLAVDIGTTAAVRGCGVWELQIDATGKVTDAKLLRGEPVEAYERFVGGWLRLFQFQANDGPWTSVVLIRFTE